eukprot:6182496-Pleurochrysis_carterae.AAC.2
MAASPLTHGNPPTSCEICRAPDRPPHERLLQWDSARSQRQSDLAGKPLAPTLTQSLAPRMYSILCQSCTGVNAECI